MSDGLHYTVLISNIIITVRLILPMLPLYHHQGKILTVVPDDQISVPKIKLRFWRSRILWTTSCLHQIQIVNPPPTNTQIRSKWSICFMLHHIGDLHHGKTKGKTLVVPGTTGKTPEKNCPDWGSYSEHLIARKESRALSVNVDEPASDHTRQFVFTISLLYYNIGKSVLLSMGFLWGSWQGVYKEVIFLATLCFQLPLQTYHHPFKVDIRLSN